MRWVKEVLMVNWWCMQMMAVVTIGFVKDAKDHVNLQGFNVYHKNRLIKVLTSDGTLLPVWIPWTLKNPICKLSS